MKKFFFTLAAALCSLAASAQWTSGAEAVADGEYAFFNAATGQFINYGDTWGTRAWMRNAGVILTLRADNDNFKIQSNVQNKTAANSYMGDDGCWLDNAGLSYTFENIATVEGEFVYTLKSSKGYVKAEKDNGCTHEAEVSENSQWILVTNEMIVKASESATEENPFELTTLIKCANFDRNSNNTAVWGTPAPSIGGANNNMCGEVWGGDAKTQSKAPTFDFNQTLTNLKAGKYVLKIQGFYRAGAPADAHENNPLNASIYANEATLPLQSLFAEEAPAAGNADTFNYPNSMADASACFSAGQYENSLEFTLEADGDITIGIKKDVELLTDWTIFDNVRLYYYGAGESTSTPTEVEKIANDNIKDVIYDLSGRRVEKASKGIYIINGKKVIK